MLCAVRAAVAPVLIVLLLAGTASPAASEGSAGIIDGAQSNFARRQALLHRQWPSDGVPGSIIVTTGSEAVADAVQAREGGVRLGDLALLLSVEPGTEATVAGRVAGRPGVIAVEPDHVRELAARPGDPRFGEQWAHDLANAAAAWDETTGSSSVTVAILDTGVDADHPDLDGNIVEQVDVSSGRVVELRVGRDNDSCDYGHGTFVAGVLGAEGDNGEGVAGVAWDVGIVDVALTSPASRCGILDSAIIAGIEYASDRVDPVDVINLSLGGVSEACPSSIQASVDRARAVGTVVVAAAGNDQFRQAGESSIPASCNGVISVAAVGQSGTVADYSQRNAHIDIAAPGGDTASGAGILSTEAGGRYGEQEGTSFSSPYVAGAVALLRSLDSTLSPDDIEYFLESTADDRGAIGRDDAYGWGTIDLAAAVREVAAGATAGVPVADPRFPVNDRGTQVDRIAATGSTNAIGQAVAMSEETFDAGSALHAVVARSDDFADALAGSALGFGVGPVLFTSKTGPLSTRTANELRRALPSGSTVYILGGSAALPATLEREIEALGLHPVRLAGRTRELTAVGIAEELESFLAGAEFEQPAVAMIATAFNWPDAVTAGSFGALFGIPVLVTAADELHPAVADFLSARSWDGVYIAGGTAAISEATRTAIRAAARTTSGDTHRLAGTTRSGTAVAVAEELEELTQLSFGVLPQEALAVNLRRSDGFAHVLSASARLGQRSGVFVPVEGEGGDQMSDEAQRYVCRFPVIGVVVGGADVVARSTEALFDALLKGEAPACR